MGKSFRHDVRYKACAIEINECALYNNCDPNAQCINMKLGSSKCRCNAGYQGDGFMCRPIVNCDGRWRDVGFILDASGSIGGDFGKGRGWKLEKEFVKETVRLMSKSKQSHFRFSLGVFSGKTKLHVPFSEKQDAEKFINAVDSLPYEGSITRIDQALKMARTEMFNGKQRLSMKNGKRVPQTLILLTDGTQTYRVRGKSRKELEPTQYAKQLRDDNIRIITIGVSDVQGSVNRQELAKISGKAMFSYVIDFKTLMDKNFLKLILSNSCQKEPKLVCECADDDDDHIEVKCSNVDKNGQDGGKKHVEKERLLTRHEKERPSKVRHERERPRKIRHERERPRRNRHVTEKVRTRRNVASDIEGRDESIQGDSSCIQEEEYIHAEDYCTENMFDIFLKQRDQP